MANTINDLYQKYTNKVGRTLEADRYFQYLYAMVESSENIFSHNNRVLHKVVDERWLSIIEESLDAINTIIEKPRRFVTTKEEVVPVALAKKITADSVRHLSMNTQFIASDENGDIQPTRILNVSTEESFDLYENRFIYHLIQRLVTFIDKRTDVIFWSTGDETANSMTMESKVEDGYEEIDFKLEMTIKNRQSFVENDSDNMNVFMRIDHVRRLVMALRHSSFCSLMAGCSKVHSPIQRTNLMMKDPNYRTCYKLWQFLESYDEVGYTIDVRETPLEFDEEYMIQMYTNLITNYTVFKSILEADGRNLDEIPPKKRRVIKPKFIKQIKEEFVLDRDLPDVEIRQVFIDEVTEAQLAAEARVKELTDELAETNAALDKSEISLQESFMKMNDIMQQQIQTQRSLDDEIAAKDAAIAERNELEASLSAQINDLSAKLAETEGLLSDVRAELLTKEEALEIKEAELAGAIQAMQDAILKKDAEIAAIKAKAESDYLALQQKMDSELAEAEANAVASLAKLEDEKNAELEAYKAEALAAMNELKAKNEAELSNLKNSKDAEIASLSAKAESDLNNLENKKNSEIADIKAKAESDLASLDRKYKGELIELENNKDAEIASLNASKIAELKDLEEKKARELKEHVQALNAEHASNIDKLKAEASVKLNSVEEYKNAEAKKMLNEVDAKYRGEISALNIEYSEYKAKAEKEISEIKASNNELSAENSKALDEIKELKAALESMTAERDSLESKYTSLKKRRSFFKKNKDEE